MITPRSCMIYVCGVCVFPRPVCNNNVRRNIARRNICLIIMTIITHIIYIYRWTRFVCIAQLPVATIRREAKNRSDFSRLYTNLQFGRRRRRRATHCKIADFARNRRNNYCYNIIILLKWRVLMTRRGHRIVWYYHYIIVNHNNIMGIRHDAVAKGSPPVFPRTVACCCTSCSWTRFASRRRRITITTV